jgi:hypothetical protein
MRGRVAASRKNKLFILWMLLTLEILVKACKHCVIIGRTVLLLAVCGFLLRGGRRCCFAIAQAISTPGGQLRLKGTNENRRVDAGVI